MRLRKIYNRGKILNENLYQRLIELDSKVFAGCYNEFKENRDWWVVVDNNSIIAFCGCSYSDGVCIFVRAWVYKPYRGQGLQSRMIKARLKAAYDCNVAITYTSNDNIPSINNLFKNGFKLYYPSYAYVGKDVLYFKREI